MSPCVPPPPSRASCARILAPGGSRATLEGLRVGPRWAPGAGTLLPFTLHTALAMPQDHPARLLPAVLSFLVGVVSLRMAVKGLSTKEWLPFHRAAAAVDWTSLPHRLRVLLLFLVRMTGLAFLVLFLLLMSVSILLPLSPAPFVDLAILGSATAYCVGLGILTRWLRRETGADTPWRGAFAAAGVLALASLLSLVTG